MTAFERADELELGLLGSNLPCQGMSRNISDPTRISTYDACAEPTPSGPATSVLVRSEEHTYELQSLMRISYAVFCLKKKQMYIIPQPCIYYHTTNHTINAHNIQYTYRKT